MADDKQNRTFNLDDFRRYQNGSMSFEEQHSLEKSMLEDPFLAEAYEGFRFADSNKIVLTEINKELNTKLNQRVQDKKRKLIPLWAYPVAATIVIGFTIGWLVYLKQESLTSSRIKSEQLSSIVKPEPQIAETEDSSPIADSDKSAKSTFSLSKTNEHLGKSESKLTPIKTHEEVASLDVTKEDFDQNKLAKGESVAVLNETAVANAPAPTQFSAPAQAQAKSSTLARDSTPNEEMVSGRLVDSDNQPIPGATILSSKTGGTLTDAEGRFTIQSKIGDSLSALFIGYKTKKIKAEKADLGTIKLDEDLHALSEVVVVGYGAQQKKSSRARKEVSDSIKPEPLTGWPTYNEYLKKMTSVSEIKGNVKISFTVDDGGSLTKFKTTGKEELFELAKKIILEGAGWKPGTKGNVPTSMAVTITLRFR